VTELERKDFDAHEFVALARRSTPLDELCGSLAGHLAELRASLIDAINQDYAAFVGMASNLRGLDKAVSKVKAPVELLRAEIQEVRDAAAAQVDQLDAKLSERRALLQAQRRLELLLNAEESITRMEGLLEARQAEEDGNKGREREFAVVLERIANESARLAGQVVMLEEDTVNSRRMLGDRLDRLKAGMLSSLDQIFARCVSGEEGAGGGWTDVTKICLRVYDVTGSHDACEAVIRRAAVVPFINEHVTEGAIEQGQKGSCEGLGDLYKELLHFAEQHLLALTQCACDALGEIGGGGSSRLIQKDFVLVSCLLAEAAPALLNVGGKRLTHYLDKSFGAKYLTTLSFLSSLERLCGSRSSALAMRKHAAYVDFMHKWELPLRAHFQLRFQEVTEKVSPLLVTPQQLLPALEAERVKAQAAAEKEARKASEGQGGDGDLGDVAPKGTLSSAAYRLPLPASSEGVGTGEFSLKASAIVWEQVQGLWVELLPVHTHRLLQLALMLLARYSEWTQGWLEHLSKPPEKVSDKDDEANTAARADEQLRLASSLMADCVILAKKTNSFFAPLVTGSVFKHGIDAADVIKAAIDPTADSLQGRVHKLSAIVVNGLSTKCVEPLTAIRAITSQYRMTNKPAPTKPSFYVQGVVQPFKSALSEKGVLGCLEEESRALVVKDVVVKVAAKFLELVEELFTNVKRLSQTLKKLNKAGAGGGSGVGDDDKIYLQVQLDVQALSSELTKLGVDFSSVENFTKLNELVKTACAERDLN